ncbi:glycosyltransferase [Arthrobacter sp. NPDC089319]|uniref:glycosyltransferase n=1 Tax=Arthrobacter sp. NPDC089319 TaxID=3155915 RepID=UPI0034405F4F
MRILVCPHQMVMGGSQINAIELAAAVKKLGHEVLVYAPDGVLVQSVKELGLELVQSPDGGSSISREWMTGLSRLVRERHIDLVHAYEWAPCIEAAFGPHLLQRTPLVMTVLSMDVPEFLPTHTPIIVGTAALAAQQASRRSVYLMEPPIDTTVNATGDVRAARARWGAAPGDIVVSLVCRLSTDLEKLQGVLTAIDVVDELSRTLPLKLIIAGDGEGAAQVSERAQRVNSRHGRQAVCAVGNLVDPTSVYDASDIALGMGSSALKAMAFAKPLIVQGIGGYWRPLNPGTVDEFLLNGWFGSGGSGASALKDALADLADDAETRAELGRFGRQLVLERFSVESAATVLEKIYQDTLVQPAPLASTVRSLARSAVEVGKFRAFVRVRDLTGRLRKSETGSSR